MSPKRQIPLTMNHFTSIVLFISILSLNINSVKAEDNVNIVVAQDGSGDFAAIQEAINFCKAFRNYRQVIYIKNGIYHEKLLIDSFLTHITLIGESTDRTIITNGDHANMEGFGTFNSYTIKVVGDFVTIENLTIENSAGKVGQAVALHVEGDGFIIRKCNLLGNQDTLYAAGKHSRQIYSYCYIEGTTDFIFGAAIAVFDSCTIHSKKNSYITAASTIQENKFGYVFRHCILTSDPDVIDVYLGRPWRDYARVVLINCEMGEHIKPEGWHNWDQPDREKTAFYAEYKSTEPGGDATQRVNWSHQLSNNALKKYTIENIFRYNSKWIPNEHFK
jgi:pectinesterase